MAKKQDNKLQELEQKIAELDSQLKRAVADYHNLEKRVAEGRSELTKWGTSELLVKLLPALDHLEQALEGASEADRQSGWFRGVELAVKELNQVLQGEGLSQIAADGQFDPNIHEPFDKAEGENNMILKVVRKGYNLNGKVVRPAGVVVGRKTVIGGVGKQSGSEEKEIAVPSNEGPTSAPRNDEEREKGEMSS